MQSDRVPETTGRRRRAALLALAGLCLLLALGAAPAAAAPGDQPEPQDWATNGTVHAVAPAPDGSTYIGGSFSRVGQLIGGFAAIEATSGAPDASWPIVDGWVRAVAPDGAGGWFIGGEFRAVGGVARRNLAHIRADGTLDPAWDPDVDGSVDALAVSGGTVYVGGYFEHIGGQDRDYIAALEDGRNGCPRLARGAEHRVRGEMVHLKRDGLPAVGEGNTVVQPLPDGAILPPHAERHPSAESRIQPHIQPHGGRERCPIRGAVDRRDRHRTPRCRGKLRGIRGCNHGHHTRRYHAGRAVEGDVTIGRPREFDYLGLIGAVTPDETAQAERRQQDNTTPKHDRILRRVPS